MQKKIRYLYTYSAAVVYLVGLFTYLQYFYDQGHGGASLPSPPRKTYFQEKCSKRKKIAYVMAD